MAAGPFNRTASEAGIKRASQLARVIVGGQISPIDAAQEIAWLAPGACNDFRGDRM
jgi:hypothetical protein